MRNPDSYPQYYFRIYAELIEILNDKGSYYAGYLNQTPRKCFISIQIPTTYESLPQESFVFYRNKLYAEADYKEVIDSLQHFINNQKKGILF